LTGAEADIITWEERNTEIYRWLNDAVPPYDDALLQRRAGGPSGVLTPRARTMPPRDDTQGLVRMASVVHRAPALSWSAATVIPRLHDQANIQQQSSKCIQNARSRRVF